jgi:hypothetical protein
MVLAFGTNIGGAGVNYLIGRIVTVNSATSITIVDGSGNPLLAQASAGGCYMALAAQVFTYDLDVIGQQVTPPLLDPYVSDCMAHSIGLHLLTNATRGRVFTVTVAGTKSEMPTSLTS